MKNNFTTRAIFVTVLVLIGLCYGAIGGYRSAPKVQAQIYPAQCTPQNGAAECSPAQLGASAITLPASGQTALSTIIDTREVREASLLWACTQNATAIVTVYDEDGATSFQSYTPYSTAAALGQLLMGSEHAPLSDTGSGNAANIVFPQRALSFKWNNSTAVAGTCTARLYLKY